MDLITIITALVICFLGMGFTMLYASGKSDQRLSEIQSNLNRIDTRLDARIGQLEERTDKNQRLLRFEMGRMRKELKGDMHQLKGDMDKLEKRVHYLADNLALRNLVPPPQEA